MNPPTAVVHIGVEKTGSTYLQGLLLKNAAGLAKQGVGYAKFLAPTHGNQHILAAYAVDTPPRQDIHRFHQVTAATQPEFRKYLRGRLTAAVAEHDFDRWVFSSEHLSSRVVTSDSVERFVDLISSAGLTPRLLLYVRPQEDMIESTYSTAISSGSVERFDLDREIAHRDRYDFARLLQRWEQQIPREWIQVLEYTPSADPTSLAQSFCHAVGLRAEELTLPANRANTSLPRAHAELLRIYTAAARRAPSGAPRSNRPALLRRLRRLPGEPFRLTPEERAAVAEAYAESNEWLATSYGLSLRHRATDATARSETFTVQEVRQFLDALLATGRPGEQPAARSEGRTARWQALRRLARRTP